MFDVVGPLIDRFLAFLSLQGPAALGKLLRADPPRKRHIGGNHENVTFRHVDRLSGPWNPVLDS
jgi:hypothetical protein